MNEPTQTPSSKKSKKGFFQYRLTTLMIVCTIVAMVIGYGVRRYQANARLYQMWLECETFMEDDFRRAIATCDEIDGQVLISEMKPTGIKGYFFRKGIPIFESPNFVSKGRAVFRWNGKYDEYAFILIIGTLPKFGTKPEFKIVGYHRKLDHVVIDELTQFVETKFGLVPSVVYNDQLGVQE